MKYTDKAQFINEQNRSEVSPKEIILPMLKDNKQLEDYIYAIFNHPIDLITGQMTISDLEFVTLHIEKASKDDIGQHYTIKVTYDFNDESK